MKNRYVSLLIIFFFVVIIFGCSKPPESNIRESFWEDKTLSYNELDFYDESTGLHGLKNEQGEVVLEPKFDSIWINSEFVEEGLIPVSLDSKVGFINIKGETVIPLKFDWVDYFSEGFAAVVYDSNFIPDWDEILSLCSSYDDKCTLSVFKNQMINSFAGHWGYIYKNGSIVIEPKFDDAKKFSEGLAAVLINGKWGFIDIYGNFVISPTFSDVSDFSEGLAPVANSSGNWGYVDDKGNTIIEPQFTGARIFSQGLAAVRDSRKWGYIDKSGKIIIEPMFEKAEEFDEEGMATIWVPCTAENESCVMHEWTNAPHIIYKSDYIKEDNLFVSIIRKTFGDEQGENIKSFLFNISKNKTHSTIARIVVSILGSILFVIFYLIISIPIINQFPGVFNENPDTKIKEKIKNGYYIVSFLLYLFIIDKIFGLILY